MANNLHHHNISANCTVDVMLTKKKGCRPKNRDQKVFNQSAALYLQAVAQTLSWSPLAFQSTISSAFGQPVTTFSQADK